MAVRVARPNHRELVGVHAERLSERLGFSDVVRGGAGAELDAHLDRLLDSLITEADAESDADRAQLLALAGWRIVQSSGGTSPATTATPGSTSTKTVDVVMANLAAMTAAGASS